MNMDERALTIQEVAKFLHISKQMVYNLIKQKELDAFKIGKAIRILYSDLLSYVKEKKQEFAGQDKPGNKKYINSDDSLMVVNTLGCKVGTFILENINFSFPRGNILAILGPSGSGKSMLLRSIAGLQKITSGAVFLGKKRIDTLEVLERHIGFVFQDYALFPNMSAMENIMFPLFTKKQKKAKEDDVALALKELHLDSFYLPFKPGELPEGIKQLIAIGREKIRDIDLFLMDEPMSHLDKDLKKGMRIIIKKLLTQLKKTTIICLNDPFDALALSNYVVIIIDGKVKRFGKTREVYEDPQLPEVIENFSCYGVNKLNILTQGNNTPAFPVNITKGKGDYTLYFRTEEIDFPGNGNGMSAKIIRESFIDGKNKLVQCRMANDLEIQLIVPRDIKDKVVFLPRNPLFVPVK